jgi:hypothetical protein
MDKHVYGSPSAKNSSRLWWVHPVCSGSIDDHGTAYVLVRDDNAKIYLPSTGAKEQQDI